MLVVMFIWAFTSFLYFKVVFDATYYNPITITAALIIGIVTALWTTGSAALYAIAYRRNGIIIGVIPVTTQQVLKSTFVSFLCCLVVYIVIIRLVVFGFSKHLSSNLRIFSDYYGLCCLYQGITDNFMWFAGLSSVPMLLHYLLNYYGVITLRLPADPMLRN